MAFICYVCQRLLICFLEISPNHENLSVLNMIFILKKYLNSKIYMSTELLYNRFCFSSGAKFKQKYIMIYSLSS